MVKAPINGKTEECIMVLMKMTKKMDLVFTSGLMAEVTLAIGHKENKTLREYTFYQMAL